MDMLPALVRAEVIARIDIDLPPPKGGRRGCRGHSHLLHRPNRRCNGCKLEVLGNIVVDLRLLDIVELVK